MSMVNRLLNSKLLKNKYFIIGVSAVLLVAIIVVSAVLLHNKHYEVSFYSDTGVVVKVDKVQRNASAIPPREPTISYGKIFKSWDTDFSKVKKNLKVQPVCEDITGKDNVFALQGVYGKKDEFVFVPLTLSGKVCVSGFDLEITYNNKALKFDSYFNEDGAVVINGETPGKLKINFVSTRNATADVDICTLKFKVNADKGDYPLQMKLDSIYAFKDDKNLKSDKLFTPKSSVIDSTVFVIP